MRLIRQLHLSRALRNKEPVNPHRAFYQNFGGPLVKVLGVTFTTYYGLSYLWIYLDHQEDHAKVDAPVS